MKAVQRLIMKFKALDIRKRKLKLLLDIIILRLCNTLAAKISVIFNSK